MSFDNNDSAKSYWRDNLKIMAGLLTPLLTTAIVGYSVYRLKELAP